jgi:hypothetical protein
MEFSIKELEILLKGLQLLPGNELNWELQEKIITEIKKEPTS